MREAIAKEIGKEALEKIEKQIEKETAKFTVLPAIKGAWIHHYLLIDFGFNSDYFYPNSIQFYSSEFLCSKLIDNTSLVSLVPILNCKYVHVTWDTSTKKAVHIYGYQPKT
jgi:hypothetical protein